MLNESEQAKEIRRQTRLVRLVTTHREMWKFLLLVWLASFLLRVGSDLELVIHKWAVRF